MADSANSPGRHRPGPDDTGPIQAGGDDATQVIPTQGVPPQHPAPDEGQADTEGRRRDWRHIARTRARTSTVLLVGVFLLCCVLYGYTSQRYGIVDPPARPAPKSTTQTVEPSYEAPSSTFSSTTEESSSTTDTSSGVDGTEGTSGTDSQVPTTTTTRPTVPGLPNIPIPGFGGQTPTTTVPTR